MAINRLLLSLTILIPTLIERKHLLERLKKVIGPQCLAHGALITLAEDNREESIGAKRNALLDDCKTEYCAFIDDDDTVASNYVEEVYKGIAKGVDVISFKGIITSDMGNGRVSSPKVFYHKIGLTWSDNRGIYYRPPNHLNPMKTDIARAIRFPEISHGEDKEFAERLAASGLLKTEHYYGDFPLYYYQYRDKK